MSAASRCPTAHRTSVAANEARQLRVQPLHRPAARQQPPPPASRPAAPLCSSGYRSAVLRQRCAARRRPWRSLVAGRASARACACAASASGASASSTVSSRASSTPRAAPSVRHTGLELLARPQPTRHSAPVPPDRSATHALEPRLGQATAGPNVTRSSRSSGSSGRTRAHLTLRRRSCGR